MQVTGRTEWTIRVREVAQVLRQLREMQTELAEASGRFEDAFDDLVLVLEELLVNLLQHSGQREAALECKLTLISDEHRVWCEWIDNGSHFDPFESPLDTPDERGGVGLPLVRHFASECRYERRGQFNHLSFTVPLAPVA